ncbi:MAG TPA: GNAT family N-acyltransferase [Bryobacteraceae bacterium]|nr:GNAT family N-acyltransferase [Bryobacteraceae bacterium]
MRWVFPDRLRRSFPDTEHRSWGCGDYCREFLNNLGIQYSLADTDLGRVPSQGGALIVANHPFGFLEGMVLLSLLDRVRPDFRIMANSWLAKIQPLRERLIFVDSFADHAATHQNRRALRQSLEWLRSGGLLVVFPAGAVAHLNLAERAVADPPWNAAAARLAMKTGCVTLPVFFEGANSPGFQMMGTLHSSLRTLSLGQELVKKCHRTISIRVGNPITASVLKSYGDPESASRYLRARTYLLADRAETHLAAGSLGAFRLKRKPIAVPRPAPLLSKEIAALPVEQMLAQSEDFAVYVTSAQESPNLLLEIGRSREATYRQIGEGTGKALDIDEFDEYYQHIVLWNKQDSRIAGAYRLTATPDVIRERGVRGLYTSTLFHYEPAFFERIGPAIELGRSFICREYQKQYAPLLLLWRGIIQYVQRRPECAVLFGAVSVSSEYQALSRTLIVNFLTGRITNDAAQQVRPRRAFGGGLSTPKHIRQLGRLLPTVEELASSIEDLEYDRKGLPVLIKQYLKIGGQLLGFHLDPNFSNVLDVLVMADLRTASGPMLDRCMGREQAKAFRAWHTARGD